MPMPTPAPRRRAARVAAAWLAAAGLALAAAAQAQSSPYYLGGSLSVSHDSNLLRLADGQATPAGFSKSDRITSTALLAGVDQPFGRQRLYGNVALRSNRFADNAIYDNQGYTVATGLDWSTVERLSGSLAASASRNLSSYNLQEIGLLTEKNLEHVRALDASLRLGLVSEYALELSGGQRRVKNSLDIDSVQSRNYVQDTAALGARWRPAPGSSLGLALRSTQGRYPKFRLVAGEYEADRYKRRDIDLTASVKPSGASALDLRLSSGKTEYDLATQRDFSGLTGSLAWFWQPSGKIRTSTRISRDTGQDSYAVTDFFGNPGTTDYSRVLSSLRVKTDYDLSAKVALNLILSYADRDLVLTQPAALGLPPLSGRDRYTTVSLGARWAPHRSLLLGCDLVNERRRGSGDLGTDVKAASTSCFGQFTLQ
jgi:hypothetical protein